MKDRIIIITGPTASGKSDIALNLARSLETSIISSDSQQVYRFMDIGTNKTKDIWETDQYLLDVVDPNENFSVADFSKLANKLIGEINNKGNIPIVAGGTGLYIDSLIFDMNYGRVKKDQALRRKLEEEAKKFGNQYLHQQLASIDKISAKKYHPNEVNRIIRALEIYQLTNKKPSEIRKGENKLKENVDPMIFFLNYKDRDILYERINLRVVEMIKQGLVDEVRNLIKDFDLDENSQSMAAIGYKEVLTFLNDKISYDEMIDLIQKNTRHYAKRQVTWMKKYLNLPFSFEITMDDLNKKDASDIILTNIKEVYGL
ncbi:MAG: tRNA (adenosine(37)-N6)-dimethylallyltransferase MiaA [Tissierellia bacterium]|nr:tRNA (adenosine(37)-N6)-dimethylallyltransferase MiaA [Tissierellia bacterium]